MTAFTHYLFKYDELGFLWDISLVIHEAIYTNI